MVYRQIKNSVDLKNINNINFKAIFYLFIFLIIYKKLFKNIFYSLFKSKNILKLLANFILIRYYIKFIQIRDIIKLAMYKHNSRIDKVKIII